MMMYVCYVVASPTPRRLWRSFPNTFAWAGIKISEIHDFFVMLAFLVWISDLAARGGGDDAERTSYFVRPNYMKMDTGIIITWGGVAI